MIFSEDGIKMAVQLYLDYLEIEGDSKIIILDVNYSREMPKS